MGNSRILCGVQREQSGPLTKTGTIPLPVCRSDDSRQIALYMMAINVANCSALWIEGLCGYPKKVEDGARLVRDFQPPFGAVSKPRDGVADHIRTRRCCFVPNRIVLFQIDRYVA
jgi:hypothetical protein